jgi:hypothetical protein
MPVSEDLRDSSILDGIATRVRMVGSGSAWMVRANRSNVWLSPVPTCRSHLRPTPRKSKEWLHNQKRADDPSYLREISALSAHSAVQIFVISEERRDAEANP